MRLNRRAANLVEMVVSRLPTRSRASLVQRLVARANAERDAKRYPIASALYEEALRLSPGNARVRIQCGHMYKEAGDHDAAERHYLEAARLIPEDADLALQLGHFYKVSEQPDRAEECYRRATELRPGWQEAEEELARLRPAAARDGRGAAEMRGIVSELLPASGAVIAPSLREGFHVARLGANRARVANGYRRVLRGVEAIRGFVIASTTLREVTLAVDGQIIAREPLQGSEMAGGGQSKYVFNLWHDFTDMPPGSAQVELKVSDGRGWTRTHRAIVEIVAPLADDAARSDTIVAPARAGQKLEAEINARPSIVRPARRRLLSHPPRVILVQRADQLGDLACSVPALIRLRARFPDAKIVALLTASNADLGRTLPMIDEIVVAEFREEIADGRRTMSAAAQEALRGTLGAYDFDVAVDLAETGGSRPLLLLSGAKFLFGFKDRDFPWLTAGFELSAHDPGNHHEMAATGQKLVAMIDSLATIIGDDAQIVARHDDAALLAGFGLAPGTRYVVLHTGARLAYSRWPGFGDLAALLIERTDLTIVLMGEAIPVTLEPTARIIPISGLLSFAQFDALLSGCAAFVGNDSGPKHLASLRGAPVVSLHMARLNWNEWGQNVTGSVISRKVPCAGCGIGSHGEECGKDFACIRHIRAEEVFDAVIRLL